MKRDEFKLLMEDWKRNFVTEDEVVSNTLNEGYTELDRAILEEGLKDNPIIQKVVKLGVPLGLAATLFSSGLLNNNYSTDYKGSHTRGGIHNTIDHLKIPRRSAKYDKSYDVLFNSPQFQEIVNDENKTPEEVAETILKQEDLKQIDFGGENQAVANQTPDDFEAYRIGDFTRSDLKKALKGNIKNYRKSNKNTGK